MILVLGSQTESYWENPVLVQTDVELESYFQYFSLKHCKKGIYVMLNMDVIKVCNFYLKLFSNSENVMHFKEN